MERRFKKGDRVYHHPEGTGTVTGYQDGRVIVAPDDDFYKESWLCDEDSLEPAAPKSRYYYEEVTRNGRQWFRMTPKGDWMPKPDSEVEAPKYDRAGMATALMAALCGANHTTNIPTHIMEELACAAVKYTGFLITELQRTKP